MTAKPIIARGGTCFSPAVPALQANSRSLDCEDRSLYGPSSSLGMTELFSIYILRHALKACPFKALLSKARASLVLLQLCPAFLDVHDNLVRNAVRKPNRFNPNYLLRTADPSITARSNDQFPIAVGYVSESEASVRGRGCVQRLWSIPKCGCARSIDLQQFYSCVR